MEVFSPVAALAASLIDEPGSQNSTRIEENISGELFNKPAAKAEKTDNRNKEEVHKKTSNKAKDTGKAPDLIPAKKTKNDHESMNPAKQTKNDYEILVPAKEKVKQEAKAEEEAKAKEEQAAKEKAELDKIEKEKQEALKIEAERQAQAARANDAEAAAAEAEYRDAHQKRLELEKLLEEKLKEKGLRDQQKQSEKSLNREKSNKLEDKEENKLEDENEEGFLDKVKNFFAGDIDIARMMEEFRAQFPTEQTQEEIDAGLIMVQPFNKQEEEAPKRASFRSAFRSMAFWLDDSDKDDENSGLELSDEEVPGAVGANPNDLNLDGKKFTVMTRFETSNALGPIKPGQYFNIHLDKELTVKDPSSLEPVRYNGQVIATPTYNSKDNIIEYKIVKEIPENIKVPLNIPVDYNPDNITEFNNDGTFTVTNKVSGLGVKAPKDLIPQKVDKNGNLAGSIIEPGRGDVPELIESDDKSYKVDMDAVGIPVVENGVLKGFNWTAQVVSTVNLNGIDFHVNFTTVKGSGLGEIQNLALGGVKIDNPDNNGLTGKLGIVDSVHYKPAEKDGNKFTYTFYTPVTDIQETYMLDINAVANGKVGAKRIVGTQGYPRDKVADATPKRVGMNNRTSILGEFANSNQAKWTVTDQVSTGDDGKLPLASRKLGGNQTLNSGQVAVYRVDTTKGSSTYGQMISIGSAGNANPIPKEGTNPDTAQAVGTIAAYEYTTDLDQQNPSAYTLGGVAISKTQDLQIDQNWSLEGDAKMPKQTIKAVGPNGEDLGSTTVQAETDANKSSRRITIPNVKVWDIDNSGKATKIHLKVDQGLPKEDIINEKTYQYLENYNYYEPSRHEYFIHNRAVEKTEKKFGKFILNKTDADGKPLEGATFRLFPGPEVLTDKDGKATFDNIEPGTYTLMEVKAPLGYKPADDTKIVVDENGKVKAAGDNASQSSDETATKYYEDAKYPLFMNLKSYAVKQKDGKTVTYIFLKPREGGGTNQNTRLNIRGYINDNNLKVNVFDVSPGQRPGVSQAMDLQSSPDKSAGGDVLNQVHNFAITGNLNIKDGFTGQNGYQIKFPHQRFGTNWGFLVKVEGTTNSNDGKVSYDWLLDADYTTTQNNSKIQKTITPADSNQNNTGGSTSDEQKETVITVKNEKFKTSHVEVTKVNSNKDRLGKATFVLKDANGNILKTVVSNPQADSEGKGKGKVDFGEMPPGYYVIEEIKAPDGYIESQLVFDVIVDKANQVKYSARFKDGKGTPVPGVDYWIENEVIADEDTKVPVTTVNQKLYISEGNPNEKGTKEGVWEAYRYESLNYEAEVTTSKAAPGGRLTFQFDRNLDFTQYVNEIPKIKDAQTGAVIAEPYFDYKSNTLTYLFTKDAKGGELNFHLKIQGVIPSKFYAKNSGSYTFTNVVAPGQTNVKGNQKETTTIEAFYDDYDSAKDGSQPTQMYYFRDVYKEGDQWYVKALAYYNPMANAQGSRRDPRILSFNWMSTDFFGNRNIARWEGKGTRPAFEIQDLKVYRVLPVSPFKNYKTNEPNMPRSMGITPENDPSTYNLVYSQPINPKEYMFNSQGNISATYDPSKIISVGGVNTSLPLSVSMPRISDANEGYVIEQTFKVTNLDTFRRKFRTFYMTNGNLESAFASKVNLNESAASQASKEIPKYYKQRIMMVNEEYVPTSFKIKKFSEADNSPLAGAVFTLTDKNNKAISKTTGSDGILTFDNLQPGEYTLKETSAPEGFNKIDKTWHVNVSKDGTVTITELRFDGQGDNLVGKDLLLEVANRPTGTDFKVYKKDDTNKPLKGAEFKLSRTGYPDKIVTSDENGLVNFKKLTQGTYILEETKPPVGFKKLDKKWVVEVDKNQKAKIYEYKDPSGPKPEEKENTDATKSLFGEDGTKWVDVAKRPFDGWTIDDNRWGGYTGNNQQPYKMGTRILGINKKDGYVIQRYVINPEGNTVKLNYVSVHREKPWYSNMDWYNGETYKIFKLDKPVTGYVEDIRLKNYNITDITSDIETENKVISGEHRLYLNFKNKDYDKPIVIDVKIPYKSINGGVGTGMDLYADGTVYWKSDYYESASYIVEGDDVNKKNDPGTTQNIKGDHVSDDNLDVTNERKRHEFKFKKINKDKPTDGVTGATFKLTGPKKSEEDLGQEQWSHSGTDGMVNFKGLLPGTYKLEETGAAQGYELANTDWTVTILDNGKIYIKDNNSSNKVLDNDPEKKWQKVDTVKPNANRHQGTYTSNGSTGRLATKIIEVNKATNKFRQIYIINGSPEYLKKPYFELHAEKETRGLTLDNTRIVSMNLVDRKSTLDNLINVGASIEYETQVYVKNNGQKRIKITPKNLEGEDKTIALTIETEMPKQGTVGTGLDFINYDEKNHYWLGEYYDNADSFVLGPIQESEVDKNANLQVEKEWKEAKANTNTTATRSAEILEEAGIQPISLMRTMYENPEALMFSNNLIGNPVGAGNNLDAISPYNVDADNANIEVSAGAVDTTNGSRDVSVKITPKTNQTGANRSHWVLLIDRSRDWSNKNNLDNNINKFLTDLRTKADTPGAEVYVSLIEYSNTKNMNKLLVSKRNIKDLDSVNSYSYIMTTLSDAGNGQFNLNEQSVIVRDYLSAVGIDRRNNDTNDGAFNLKPIVDANINDLTRDTYDNKYVINFANFNVNNAKRNFTGSPKFYQFESMWAFFQKGYTRVYTHVDQENTSLAQRSTGEAFRNYVDGNSDKKSFDLTNSYTLRIHPSYPKSRGYGPYVQKDLLDSILNNKSNFASQGKEESLIKNAAVNFALNNNIKLQSYKIIKNSQTVQSQPNPMSNSLDMNNISLGIGESLEFKYRIGLEQNAQNNSDLPIHKTMTYKADGNSNPINLDTTGMVTRRNTQGYIITFDQMTNGNVTATKTSDIGSGESITLTAHPDPGYKLAKLYMDGNLVQTTNNEFTFDMPSKNVRISAVFEATSQEQQTYDVTVYGYIYNGKVTPNKTKAKAGEEVTLTIEPDSGYELKTLYYNDEITGDDIPIINNKFIMPKSNVRINATFGPKDQPQPQKHKITTSVTGNIGGSLVANPTSQEQGKPVTITVKPDNGYETTSLTLNGQPIGPQLKPDGTYTFTMGDKDVHVVATFNKKEVVPETIYDVGVDGNPNRKVVVYTRTVPNKAKAGELVEFTVIPNDDYEIIDVWVQKSDGTGRLAGLKLNDSKTKGSFTMPSQSVTINANVRYVQPPQGTYLVGINPNIQGGSVTTEPRRPYPNTKVRIKATPNQGMSLENLSVTKRNSGNVEVQYDNQGPYFIMPAEDVTVNAKFKEGQGPGPNPGGGSQVQPDDDKLGYLIYDPTNPDKILEKETKITNKKQGFVPKIFKRNFLGKGLEGAKFTVKKMTDNTYKTVDTSFAPLTATSDNEGNVTFKDKDNKIVALEKGFYTLTEDKAPTGYKKITADWKIEVRDDGGRVYAVYKGPSDTPSSLLNNNEKSKAGDTSDKGIIVKSRLTDINPESKTFIQRIYIDTRKYNGILNVQITPKHKREEIDRPGLPPVTIKEGVKTAYRSTYKIANPGSNKDIEDKRFDHILRTYDLSGDNVSMINTARWRPFDWGFDEDQLNLEPGVYIVEVEGYYDDSIIDKRVTNEVKINDDYQFLNKEDKIERDAKGKIITKPTLKDPYERTDLDEKDLAKLELHVDLYAGKREFKQLKLDKDGNKTYEVIDKGSYQGGAAQVTEYAKTKKGDETAKTWSSTQDPGKKYANFVGKEVVYDNKTYITGKVEPALDEPYLHADTSINLKPIYDSAHEQELPKEGMEIINDEETYNITFSKHGKDDPNWDDNGGEVTRNRLEGAIFKLQELAPGGYIDMPGTFVASAFNGFFGFRGLKPGRYRLMEVKAPEGYKPIKDAILYMTIKYTGDIVDGKTGEITPGKGLITLEYNKNANGIIRYAPEKTATEEEGKLVDYVTSATAKNMGKIINEKPGKGEVTINKKDGEGNALKGSEFKLTRISSKLEDSKTTDTSDTSSKVSYTSTSNDKGVVKFEKLPIGNYVLEETTPTAGFQNKGQKWYFTVGGKGLDPYAGPIERKGNNLTGSISTGQSKITVVKPSEADNTDNSVIKPNSAHVLSVRNDFKLADGINIRPGDYFKVELSDYMDLKGIYDKDLIDGLDIFADGIGTIAKGEYDYDHGIITYTFTDYANTYELKDFNTNLTGHIRRDKLKYSANNVPVGLKMNGSTGDYPTINVVYDLETSSHTDEWGNNLNLSSKITRYNPNTGEFEHIIYLNREQRYSSASSLVYKPGTDVENLRIEEYKINEQWTQSQNRTNNINLMMPPSFYLDPNYKQYFRKVTDDTYSWIVNDDSPARVNYNDGDLDWNDTYVLRVTGRIAKEKDRSYFNPTVRIDNNNHPVWSAREDYVYEQWNKNLAEGKMEITAINPKNEITFKKLDQAGEILPGATFRLVKYNEETREWKDVANSIKTSGKDGLIKYEKLAPGKYALVETKAPEGYSVIDGHAAEFTVRDDGVITRKVKKPKTAEAEKPVGDSQTEPKTATPEAGETVEPPKQDTADQKVEMVEVDEPITLEPIDIINYKEIEFIKVDGNDKNVFLPGAVFEVYKKDDNGEYQPVMVANAEGKEETMTVTSDENGKFKPKVNKPGDYALKEIKAPKGYTKIPGWIREFRLANGKLYTLEKDPIKASYTDSPKGKISSEVLSVNKDARTFKQRIIINPNHEELTIPNFNSFLRILENDWSITPKSKNNVGGGEIKVALLKKDGNKKLSDLEDKDYTTYGPKTYSTVGENTGSRYSLKEITGNNNTDGAVTITDSIVVEYTGKIEEGKTELNQKAEVILNYSIADKVEYNLDWTSLVEGKPVYDEYDLTKQVEVENRKSEYPHTGGMGTLIFTLAGLMLMSAAAYVYSRKRGVSYDD